MFLRILLVILFAIGFFAIGFGCGYGVRELISRRRRADEREKFLRRKQKQQDEESKKFQTALLDQQSRAPLDILKPGESDDNRKDNEPADEDAAYPSVHHAPRTRLR